MNKPIILFVFLIGFFLICCNNQKKFDKKDWISNSNARSEMTTDLLKNFRLLGMYRLQIDSFLGPPDWIRYRVDNVTQPVFFSNTESVFVYRYNCYEGDGGEYLTTLQLEFDKSQSVVACWLSKD